MYFIAINQTDIIKLWFLVLSLMSLLSILIFNKIQVLVNNYISIILHVSIK